VRTASAAPAGESVPATAELRPANPRCPATPTDATRCGASRRSPVLSATVRRRRGLG
jgi:hypothetical protein